MIRHVSAIAEVVEDVGEAVSFYRDVLGLPVDQEENGQYATVKVAGALHFSIWSRAAAAEATFGDEKAVDRVPLGFSVEFEADSVSSATDALVERGWTIVQAPKEEPWGQVTSRFMLPSGMLGGFSETPWARRIDQG
ncbi:MAG: VOC family protein [Chloroflexi bacterium]|nr:VOC family protein [Chloroflexota bacterium]